jgi:hypothetical protein
LFIQIRNFMGLTRADINVRTVSLVTGKNAAGKSSIQRAIAATIAGEILPIDGMTLGESLQLVKQGAAASSCTVTGANKGEVSVSYPKPAPKTQPGAPAPRATKFAVGACDYIDLDKKQRLQLLTEYLKAEPTEDDWKSAGKDIGLTDEKIADVWKTIRATGWDGAHKQACDEGREFKGAWRQVTGQTYGVKVGAEWLPPGWDTDLKGMSVDTAKQQLNEAKLSEEALIRVDALTEEQQARQQELAGALDERILEHDDVHKEFESIEKEIKIQKELCGLLLKAVLKPPPTNDYTCECGKTVQLTVQDGKICVPSKPVPTHEEVKAAVDAHIAACTEFDRLTQQRSVLLAQSDSMRMGVNQSRNAIEALKKLAAQPPMSSSREQIEEAKNITEHMKTRLDALERKIEADRLHDNVMKTALLVGVLDSTGLRQQKLARVLSEFNAKLLNVTESAGWKPVEVRADTNLTFGGRFFELCAESEQFRANVAMRIVLATLDKSDLIVVDGADLLAQWDLRKGLLMALGACGIPSLVLMALDKREDAPDLGKSGFGDTYWINDEAVVEPLMVVAAA